MPVHKGPDCVGEEMSRFKKGELHSGKGGKVVTNPAQARAIALSACGQSKYSEVLQSMGYPEDVAEQVTAMFAEMDWAKQFRTGKGPGPEKEDNYKTGKKEGVSPTKAPISKTGVKGDNNRNKENTESGMISPVAYPKGPGNPQGGSSKEVFGLRMLG
jgi:hypothetical protein